MEHGEDVYLIVEYQEVQNTRRSHGTDFFKSITWSAIVVFLIYKLIIDNGIHPFSLCVMAIIGILLTWTICRRHKQRLKGHDMRICQLENHFKFKAKECYDKCVPENLGVTQTLKWLLVGSHFLMLLYGALVAFDVLEDYRHATKKSTDQTMSDKSY